MTEPDPLAQSMRHPENRRAFLEDERAYMTKLGLTPMVGRGALGLAMERPDRPPLDQALAGRERRTSSFLDPLNAAV